jgi:UDP-2,4-diacetamido-2,4,6-trideoxy-beta-L-altropyranose hydrolase
MIRLRPATIADSDLLLDWANDPVTRAAGFHRQLIKPATHRRWLADRLASARGRLYVALDADGRPIGQLRLDGAPDGRVEIGIAVAPTERGRGIGHQLLRAGMEKALADPDLAVSVFVAMIRPGNEASIALFTGAGFLYVASDEVRGERALVYELPAG